MNILSRITNLKQSLSYRQAHFEDKYFLTKTLGNGSFASVYCCQTTSGSEDHQDGLAVKVFDRASQKGLRREYRNETKLLQMVSPNQYCVKMLDTFESKRFCHIVMERCGSSVQEAFLKSSTGSYINEQDLAHVFRCMLLGVQHLHHCGVVHRDIKPANLLLAAGADLADRPLVKVCDLGLGTKLPARGGLTEVCGTAPYMAPEMLIKKSAYHCEVDLWSCGVTAYLMLLGGFPYQCPKGNTKMTKEVIAEGKEKPSFKAHKGFAQPSDAAISFLRSLLNREPQLRAGCARALSSEYITSVMKPSLLELPCFGPTLSIAHDTTKDEPAAETPALRDLPVKSQEPYSSSDESTTCGSGEEKGGSFETDVSIDSCEPRHVTTSSMKYPVLQNQVQMRTESATTLPI